MLARDEGIILVRKTRQGIEAHLKGLRGYSPGPKDSSELWNKRGVFVTVKEKGSHTLRGCIGNPMPMSPLIVESVQSGILAATRDPRFSPIVLEEMQAKICLEVTVLSALEQILAEDHAQVLKNIKIGRDGLMVEGFGRHGLLLPQVAVEEDFDPQSFLANCCLKAGLPPAMWLDHAVKVFKFEGQVFSEKAPNVDANEVHFSRP